MSFNKYINFVAATTIKIKKTSIILTYSLSSFPVNSLPPEQLYFQGNIVQLFNL